MHYNRRFDDVDHIPGVMEWFTDKVLPSLAIGIIIGLFSLYIRLTSLEQNAKAEAKITAKYRQELKDILELHTTKINRNDKVITKLIEKSKYIASTVKYLKRHDDVRRGYKPSDQDMLEEDAIEP